MRIMIVNNGELLNKHSQDGRGWCNPFGKEIPVIGDIIEIGGKDFGDSYYGKEVNCEGKQYKVVKRFFKTYETYNHTYDLKCCILEVEESLEQFTFIFNDLDK